MDGGAGIFLPLRLQPMPSIRSSCSTIPVTDRWGSFPTHPRSPRMRSADVSKVVRTAQQRGLHIASVQVIVGGVVFEADGAGGERE